MKILNEGLLSKAEEVKSSNLSVSDQLDAWFEEYVPAEGKAETLGGEIVRAICKIGHRWNNDGDRFGVGYGNETCNDAVCFLLKYIPGLVDTTYDLTTYSVKEIQEDVFTDYCIDTNEYIGSSDEGYEQWLNQTYEIVANYLRAHSDLFKTPTEESYDDFYDKEWSTTYCPHFCPSCGEYIYNREDMNADSDIWDSWWSDSGHEESEFSEDYQQRASDIIRQYTDNYSSSCCSGCLSDAESELDSLWEEFEDEQDDEDYDDSDEELQESTLREHRVKVNEEMDFSQFDVFDLIVREGFVPVETGSDNYWVVDDRDGTRLLSVSVKNNRYVIKPLGRFGKVGYNWEGRDLQEFEKDFEDATNLIYPKDKELDEFEESTLKIRENRIRSEKDPLDFNESDLKDFLTENGYNFENSDDFLWVLDSNGIIIVSVALTQNKYFIESAKRYGIQDVTLAGSSDIAWEGQDFEEFKKDFKDAITTIYPEAIRSKK